MSEVFSYSQEGFWAGEPVWYPTTKIVNRSPELNQSGEFTIGELPEELKESPNALFLTPEVFQTLELGRFLLRSADFALRPDWSEGREDSTHQVFFGELSLTPDKGSIEDNEGQVTLPVAVKPFHTAHRLAVGEFSAYLHIQHEGFIPTLNPIGFWVDDTRRVNMLSQFEQEIVTLDNVDWQKTGDDPLKEHFSLFQALQRSAFILGRLHGRGYVHGDAQIKNMALANGEVRLIDLERMVRAYNPRQNNVGYLGERMRMDLDKLVKSVIQRGFLQSDDIQKRREMVNMALLAPHGSLLRHPSTPLNSSELTEILEAANEDILAKI